MTHLNVKPEELDKHSKTVAHLSERVGNCAKTGKQTNLGINSFGIIGQAFAQTFVSYFVGQANDSLDKGTERVQKVGKELAANAKDLEATEQDIAKSFGKGQ
ncbi:excreted virulence factor EspC (type VII ESX diderm) [Herbihabitans rhizosphaerae]|uniref:Excreted virulence factor EspC (Type VII ESX diderm) n=1 Tax=Herbihabitans rhizosphaerae TaxID=1872711 RepID=A0A4Q7KM24_9PSEU|nr:type VII secretion target [Herbihabitans rhizosphaerae]RZS37585.1 excreted virulence factor EspC (type VII ESX diderm) [Herbihabitans rhizosphaerae]